jgi:hypothetical protein
MVRCCSWNLPLTVTLYFPLHEKEAKISHLFEIGINIIRQDALTVNVYIQQDKLCQHQNRPLRIHSKTPYEILRKNI